MIGEKILRLPSSDPSRHNLEQQQRQPPKSQQAKIVKESESVHASGVESPAHPIPTSPAKGITATLAISNLIKGTMAFTISGLLHDIPAGIMYLNSHPSAIHEPISLNFRSIIYTTPFFTIQALALAFEAVVKRTYRRFKISRGIAKGSEPEWLVFIERLFSFICVWTWLCRTSRIYVEGVARMRLYHYSYD